MQAFLDRRLNFTGITAVIDQVLQRLDSCPVKALDDVLEADAAALDRLGLADNTVVFFMSDNGGLSTAEGAPTSNLPLRAGKGWLYEGGIREPMIVKWPGVIKPGSTSSTPVISTDFYPTILEMAGLPARPQQHVDGVSMVPLVKQTGSAAERAIYWHYPHYGNQGGSPGSAVRVGDWKLIEFFEDRRLELYDLKEDLGEQHNLALQEGKKAAELHAKLKAWRTTVGARIPSPNPNRKAGGPENAGILLNGCRRLITVKEGQLAPATVRRARKREHGCNCSANPARQHPIAAGT